MNKNSKDMARLNRKAKKNETGNVYATHTDFNTHGKKHTVTVTANAHAGDAFMEPAEAIAELKKRGVRSWKVTGKHPANQKVKEPD